MLDESVKALGKVVDALVVDIEDLGINRSSQTKNIRAIMKTLESLSKSIDKLMIGMERLLYVVEGRERKRCRTLDKARGSGERIN